ncbi:MAG: RNA-binding S1 domain-containing protein, small subunit ribosomal protein S1 [candidate division WS6 bacterium GW2011_GWC1_33_20]|uniref:RNA-binding S1 domain-containing protein, small subunit ribosomal protein S1 n=1 Tax=candidate division WS6 bacterium GW2011_GWC1_33_20 TaxID=1619089 RepID=A0A0G0CHB1_9BACT|nr:MAG: RNA-binding S1 domain-containing protein, small subunit ribosomal protein S1 [candidate division WS6 bacterium GW2011_GWC1_33_20]KKP43973.1 MAG: RNA-binding S1 domain-containing protein, small subunit ribosomal protein S1 [candidate division WS6 bacterium GW2011_GWF1_33_233]KKP53074.1 MAG: RNA-binding S1 domain-containing protein, small subunit ribosomal protein S1 [candidate division WS6 bacterium GW2011_WS6_33_547]KKP55883.1 MAG: RNA binding S1 domain protein [candidate division WS6 ba
MEKKTKVVDTDVKDKALYSELESFLSDNTHVIKQLSKGDIVEGDIVDINNGVIVVDVGYKSEGIVAGRELKSDTLDWTTLKPGDKLLVYVVKPEDEKGQLVLSIRRTQQASAWLALENAKKNNDIVDAIVVESNNGGLIVEMGKGIRGFIPTSQLDATRVYSNGVRQVGKDISSRVQKRLNSLIGESIKTRIIELDREKNRIILSEKMVTQARDLEKRANTLKKVKEGDALEGTISGITPFGVFVNAQGLEGLVHLSELSWDKVEDIGAIYSVGDTVKVVVIGLTDGGKRVAYSIKRLQQDPWSQAISQFKIGDVVDGVIQKVVPYGAFVRIGEGLNGLIHISELSDKLVKNPEDIVKSGQEVKVKILSISSTERHLGLSLKASSDVKAPQLNEEELAEAIDAAIDSEIK